MHLVAGCAVLLLIVAGVIAIVVALSVWIKKDARHGSGQLGNALQNLEGLFIESKERIVEAKQDTHEEADESGDPPEK